jgi:hypothetical protein
VRRPSHQTAAALQTCDTRSASARFPVGAELGRTSRRLSWTAGQPRSVRHFLRRRPGNRTPLAGFGDQRNPRSPPPSLGCPPGFDPEPSRSQRDVQGHYTTDTIGSGWLDLPQRPPVPETGAHLTELHPELCSRLESNQHLLDFSQAPSPDRLQEHVAGRIGVRLSASSAIRLSKTCKRASSGTRNRTSMSRVKACRPAISRSPSIGFSEPGMEVPHTSGGARFSVSRSTPEMKKAAEVSLGGLSSND